MRWRTLQPFSVKIARRAPVHYTALRHDKQRREPGWRRPKASELQEGALRGRLEAFIRKGSGASAGSAGPPSRAPGRPALKISHFAPTN